ncbi:MAG: hypothetical protein AB7H96_24725 [Vicinamibacterales bacterium]
MNDLAQRLPQALGDTLRSKAGTPAPASSSQAPDLAPERFLSFGQQTPSADPEK